MNRINYLYMIAALLPCAIPASAAELSTSDDMLDGIAAIVNEGVVLKSELRLQTETITKRAQDQGMQLPPPDILEEQVLESLIVKRIQLQRAERIGIQVSDQLLNQSIAEVAAQNGIAFEDMPRILAEEDISYAAYRREMREQLILDQLRRMDVIGRISVAPREIDQCLADLEDNVVVDSEYNLSHILISIPESATGDELAEAETEANYVYKQLQDGSDFAELAIRYSDSQTGLEGGSLGWRKGNQLPTIFSDVVGPMEAGDFSNPIRAISGYHLVKVNDIRGTVQRSEIEQMRIRHILITPDEIIDDETAKQQLEEAVLQIKSGEDFGEIAKLFSDDPGSANDGGEMGWTGAGTYVPEFEAVANEAKIGVISEPFQARFGWHVIEVMDRRTYDNTEELKESGCVQRVRNSKLTEEEQLWVRRIRDEAFVDIRM
ncbi:MAG: molecular chaperone SurA [Woeseiaceae bacterium]|nr:molecular chaperone SurA [Woeseiaceae bacterium]